MGSKLYVGNLAFSTTSDELERAFAAVGPVADVAVIMDRETGRSKGFAFVEMASDEAAQAAIQALDGTEFGGRTLRVAAARPREPRPRQDR
jgi:RNA recognition motif-containing protein